MQEGSYLHLQHGISGAVAGEGLAGWHEAQHNVNLVAIGNHVGRGGHFAVGLLDLLCLQLAEFLADLLAPCFDFLEEALDFLAAALKARGLGVDILVLGFEFGVALAEVLVLALGGLFEALAFVFKALALEQELHDLVAADRSDGPCLCSGLLAECKVTFNIAQGEIGVFACENHRVGRA